MRTEANLESVASALHLSIGLLVRRMRQVRADSEMSLPEVSALARIDRGGPSTSAALAKLEQISPQSMGATLSALENRGYLERNPDPDDGRQVVFSLTQAGNSALKKRRSVRIRQLADALATDFTAAELKQLAVAAPLLERLAEHL